MMREVIRAGKCFAAMLVACTVFWLFAVFIAWAPLPWIWDWTVDARGILLSVVVMGAYLLWVFDRFEVD